MITSQDGTSTLKPKVGWTNTEDDEALGNSKALNVIFNGVDKNMFRLINTCIEAKEDWEILKTVDEGTSKLRMSRLQLRVILKVAKNMFILRMNEDESIFDLNIRLCDVANTSFSLREKMS